jgi:pimeloyl-ACP methyl ester carboxylesterase
MLVYVHGHGASRDSFNFIRSEIDADAICLEYDSDDGFADNLAAMVERLRAEPEIFFVGHSLGGLYALHLADQLGARCRGAVTLATPYGGSETALWLNLSFPQRLYKDIHSGATPVTQGRDIRLHDWCKWTVVVTTKGHSNLMAAANDGVVSLASMRARSGARFLEVEATHHEVLLSRHSIAIIKEALSEAHS